MVVSTIPSDGKYLLTATVRRDASSRFSKDTRWGTFPSVALGWTLTEEPWLKDNKVVSNLKLRASYGVTGQQGSVSATTTICRFILPV